MNVQLRSPATLELERYDLHRGKPAEPIEIAERPFRVKLAIHRVHSGQLVRSGERTSPLPTLVFESMS